MIGSAMPKRQAREPKKVCDEDQIREAAFDHTMKESFPASDPPSSIPNPCDADALEDAAETPSEEDDEK